MTPQIHPGSSKMSPQSLTIIDPTHFGAPSGSQTTPSAPQASPGVPRRALLGTQWDPNGPESTPGEPKRPPRGCKITLWVLPGSFGCCCCCRCRCSSSSVSSFVLSLLSLPFLFFFVVAVLGFLAVICSSLPRALDSITHRHDCSHNRAGGMRGAIE